MSAWWRKMMVKASQKWLLYIWASSELDVQTVVTTFVLNVEKSLIIWAWTVNSIIKTRWHLNADSVRQSWRMISKTFARSKNVVKSLGISAKLSTLVATLAMDLQMNKFIHHVYTRTVYQRMKTWLWEKTLIHFV